MSVESQQHLSFRGLNDAQVLAVEATEGPVLIFAGAGSGKTKCLTHRIAHTIDQKLATPAEILAISFTNKASGELSRRTLQLLGQEHLLELKNSQLAIRRLLPWVGTFHSICVRILRLEAENIGLSKNFTIYDTSDSQALVRQILKDMNLDTKQYHPGAILSVISSAKNELLSPAEYAPFVQGHFQSVALDVYKKYQSELQKVGGLDFDDLIMATVKMLKSEASIRSRYQKLFKYVLVDEYQDTNQAQYQLTKLLVNPESKNICVVGDDFQCLLPGTSIKTVDGTKKIQDISPNDKVVAASGFGQTTTSNIKELATRFYEGSIVEVETITHRKLRLTPEHICENIFFVHFLDKQNLA